MGKTIHYIDTHPFKNKRVLLRNDFNIKLNSEGRIVDDERIRQALPTILCLLKNNNCLILMSHLGRPKGRDENLSLAVVQRRLQKLLPRNYHVILIHDFMNDEEIKKMENQNPEEIFLLENLRFYSGEKKPESDDGKKLIKRLSSLADFYVNDAFSVSHRTESSVVGISKKLPSYAGLLLKKEIVMLEKVLKNAKNPLVAIIGGAKVSTKIQLLYKFIEISNYVLLGGGLANTFFAALGYEVGASFYEREMVAEAKKILSYAKRKKATVVFPIDVLTGDKDDTKTEGVVIKVGTSGLKGAILDIGPETQKEFARIIEDASTIIWNGPVGYSENPQYAHGTDSVYYAVTSNKTCLSVVGGGDTLAAISEKEYSSTIAHISTGGGAMLEFIENGTLPGIEALKR